MRSVVDLNGSESIAPAPIIPDPSAPGVLPQHPEAEEHAGIAFIMTPSGDLLDPDVVRTTFAETPRWLVTCSIAGTGPTVYRVETVFLLMSISDPFQLSSNRSGVSVQVARLSKPGRGDFGDTQYANQVSIINVHFDAFQSVVDTPCIFRPAYDRVAEKGGSPVMAWSFDVPMTDPDTFSEGTLKWTDDGGTQKSIAVTRTPRSSFSTTGHGDMLKQLIYGDFGGKGCNATIRFDIPFGYNFHEAPAPNMQPTQQLVWMCWYKQTGHQLNIGLTDEKHMSDLDHRNYINSTALLYPSLYYV